MTIKNIAIEVAQVTLGVANFAVVVPSVIVMTAGAVVTSVASGVESTGNLIIEKTVNASDDLLYYLESFRVKEEIVTSPAGDSAKVVGGDW